MAATATGASLGVDRDLRLPGDPGGRARGRHLDVVYSGYGRNGHGCGQHDAYGVLGGSTLASLTVVMPLVQGRIGQTFELTLQPAVTALTVQQTNGVVLASAISTAAITTLRFKTFSTTAFTRVQ